MRREIIITTRKMMSFWKKSLDKYKPVPQNVAKKHTLDVAAMRRISASFMMERM